MEKDKCVQSNQNTNINTYNKGYEFTHCWKCLCNLPPHTTTQFCSWDCKKEYYAEIRKENDALLGEWIGRD